MTDSRNEDGSFAIRPASAAPLFDSKSGLIAANKRWEEKEQRNKDALVRFASQKLGIDISEMTYEDAKEEILLNPLFAKAAAGHIAGTKLSLQIMGEMPDMADAKIVKDQRSINFNIYNFPDRPAAFRFIENLKNAGEFTAAAIVEAQVGEGDGPFEVKMLVE